MLVEEVRPATGAETSPRSGQQSAQQDLPKETVLPWLPCAAPAVPGVTPVQAAAAPQASESHVGKIWDAVTTFRVRGENEMTVKVQPDNDTEMQPPSNGTGSVEIEARMQQGDGRQLASGWNELNNNSPSAASTSAIWLPKIPRKPPVIRSSPDCRQGQPQLTESQIT